MVEFIVNIQYPDPTKPPVDKNLGYYYALALFGASMVGSLCLFQANLISVRVGCQVCSSYTSIHKLTIFADEIYNCS